MVRTGPADLWALLNPAMLLATELLGITAALGGPLHAPLLRAGCDLSWATQFCHMWASHALPAKWGAQSLWWEGCRFWMNHVTFLLKTSRVTFFKIFLLREVKLYFLVSEIKLAEQVAFWWLVKETKSHILIRLPPVLLCFPRLGLLQQQEPQWWGRPQGQVDTISGLTLHWSFIA